MVRRFGNKRFVFDAEIISGYEGWLNQNISLYMTRYIEEMTGKEMIREEELNINSTFAIDGISNVTKEIMINMPDFYLRYMTDFYSEDKLYSSVHDRVRLIFVKYVENERKKRLKQNTRN